MFVLSTQGSAMYRVVATLVALALVLWVIGPFQSVQAANLTSVSDTLTDSDLNAVSNHTISFTIPTTSAGVASGETITIDFPGFTVGAVDDTDIDMTIGGVEQTLVAAAPAADEWSAAFGGTTLTFTSGGASATATPGFTVVVEVGGNATGGDERLTNPGVAGSVKIPITAGPDVGETQVAIIDDVLVTAQVDTQFTFTIAGFNVTGTDANGTSTTATSTATEIDFGELTAGNIETIAQRLNVTTNAINGFVVTVQQSQNLLSATGADIDGFTNGEYTNTPINWASPTTSISLENTWGHWGLTSTDDLNSGEFQGCAGAATGCWVAASTTARQVFEHDGPADGLTDDIGSTTVAYQVQISALQEAADDYNTTLTYIATPTF